MINLLLVGKHCTWPLVKWVKWRTFILPGDIPSLLLWLMNNKASVVFPVVLTVCIITSMSVTRQPKFNNPPFCICHPTVNQTWFSHPYHKPVVMSANFFNGGKDSFSWLICTLAWEAQALPWSECFPLVLLMTFDTTTCITAYQEVAIQDAIWQMQHLQLSLLGVPLHCQMGCTILMSVFIMLLGLMATFTTWAMVSAVSEANAHCVFCSLLGQFSQQ